MGQLGFDKSVHPRLRKSPDSPRKTCDAYDDRCDGHRSMIMRFRRRKNHVTQLHVQQIQRIGHSAGGEHKRGREPGTALSNLIAKAIQYGDASEPVTALIAGNDPAFVEVSVHNSGSPIPPDVQKTIVQSWTRGRVYSRPA